MSVYTLTFTEGRRPCEDRGRDWSDVAASQGMPVIASKNQKLGDKQEADSPPEPPEGTNHANTLISDLRPPKVREKKFLLL